MKLTEVATKSEIAKEKIQIRKVLRHLNLDHKSTINDDLTVDVDGLCVICNENLEQIPVSFGRIDGDFDCSINKLKSLHGSPRTIDGDFYCTQNNIDNLDGFPNYVRGDCWLFENNIKTLHNIHKLRIKFGTGATLDLSRNPIKSHILGLMLVENLLTVQLDNKKVQQILNKHLKRGRNIHNCQEELIQAGFTEYAKL